MKILLALAAALSLSTAVHAQTDQTQSDQYACNHGDPSDPGTAAACQRLRSGEGSPAPSSTDDSSSSSETSSPPVSAAPAPETPVAALPTSPAPAAPTASAAAAPVPTDVGEAPFNVAAQNGADEANQDADNTDISAHGSWFAGLGALAVIAIAIACFSGLAIYFIPTMIAIGRHKRNTLAIFALNLFLGWSFIGWVAALIWSLASDSQV